LTRCGTVTLTRTLLQGVGVLFSDLLSLSRSFRYQFSLAAHPLSFLSLCTLKSRLFCCHSTARPVHECTSRHVLTRTDSALQHGTRPTLQFAQVFAALAGVSNISESRYASTSPHRTHENILYVMFNVGALTASHRTDWMSANPIRILEQLLRFVRCVRMTSHGNPRK
jgi:hypothetical protein